MTLIEYMNIDASTEEGVDNIFKFLEEYLNDFHKGNAPLWVLNIYEKVFDKFYTCAEQYDVEISEEQMSTINKHLDYIKDFRSLALSSHGYVFSNLSRVFIDFQEIFLTVYQEIKEKISQRKGDDVFNVLLDKNIVLKEQAKNLLVDAKRLISSNTILPEKAKTQAIDNLNSAIDELDSKRTNWSRFLGKVKKAGIILTAIVAITGYSLKDIIQANENIDKATEIIEQTTINNITISNHFMIQYNQSLLDNKTENDTD